MQEVSFNPNAGVFVDGTGDGTYEPEGNRVVFTPPMIRNTGIRYESDGMGEVTAVSKNIVDTSALRSSTGVLGTATNNGFTVLHSSDVNDSTLVTVNGMEMTAKSAASMGFIRRLPDGSYSDSKEGERGEPIDNSPNQKEHNQEEAEPPNPEISTTTIETALEAVAQDLGGYEALDLQALSAISGLVKGERSNHESCQCCRCYT